MELTDRIAAAGLEGERVRAEVVEEETTEGSTASWSPLSNLPASELNGTRVIREPDDAPTALEAARAVFRGRGHPFFRIEVEVGRHPAVEHAIRLAGLKRVDRWPTMAAPIGGSRRTRPLGHRDREAREHHDLGERFAPSRSPPSERPGTSRSASSAIGCSRTMVRMFTAWIDGEPVGEASAYLLHDTVGIFGVGVVEAARRRGVGAALAPREPRVRGSGGPRVAAAHRDGSADVRPSGSCRSRTGRWIAR